MRKIVVHALMLIAAIAVLGVAPVFAGGQGESSKGSGVMVSMLVPEPADFPIRQNTQVVQAIEEATGVHLDIESAPGDDYYEIKLPSLMAVNEVPDIFRVNSVLAGKYGPLGALVKINNYDTPNFDAVAATRPELSKVFVEGDLYYFPRLEYFRIGLASLPIIRTDLLKKYGLDVPDNFDDLFNDLMIMKQHDPNIVGISGRNKIQYVLGQWAYPLGSGGFAGFTGQGMYFEPREGRWLYGPGQSSYRTVVEYFKRLYDNGLFDPDIPLGDLQLFRQKMTTGVAVFSWDNSTKADRVYNPGLQKQDPNARFDVIRPMENYNGERRALGYFQDWLDTGYAVSAKSKHIDDAIRAYDWMYSNAGMIASNWGIEGQTYTMQNGEPTYIPSVLSEYLDKPNGYNALMSEVGGGLLAISSYVDERNLIPFQADLQVVGERVNGWFDDGIITHTQYNPPLTQEEANEFASLQQRVDLTMFVSEIMNFISGQRPMSEFDSFQKELMGAGGSRMEAIFNAAASRLQ